MPYEGSGMNGFTVNIVTVEWKIRDQFVFNELVICDFKEAKRNFLHDPALVAQIGCS